MHDSVSRRKKSKSPSLIGGDAPANEIAKRRAFLVKAGYLPIPAIGKKTLVDGWTDITEVTDDLIAKWGKKYSDHLSDGLLTKGTPGLDVDITNQMASEAVEALVRERFGEHGSILVRTGKAPKRLIPFRTDVPFDKITMNLDAPDGKAGQKIEFLADGQMFLAFGIHPDTQQPYKWHGGEPGQVKRDELPVITKAEAKALVDDIVQMLIDDYGYSLPERTTGASSGGGRDWDELVENIRTGTELHESIRDLAAKLVGHGVAEDACIGFIEDLLDECTADHDARWQARRDDIPRMVETAQEKFAKKGVALDDFRAYMPMHSYIFVPSRDMWPGTSVNARLRPVPVIGRNGRPMFDDRGKLVKVKASAWLDEHQAVEQMTWAPGQPMLIADRLISLGGWYDREGVACFNLYMPPPARMSGGIATKAGPWLRHMLRVYSKADVKHAIKWYAHRVQKPGEKINHALAMGGPQGIGKDTMLEPVKRTVGSWNFQEVSPQQAMGRFCGHLKSVILRINELRDLGDTDRFKFYNHMKSCTAAPPDVLRVDEKNMREYYVPNCPGVIYTMNEKDSLYIPADDRRTYVMWSDKTKEDFEEGYWKKMWKWYDSGGDKHVAAYLSQVDLTDFDPKAPPPKTEAFWQIVDLNRTPENSELDDLIDSMGERIPSTTVGEPEQVKRPDAMTLDDLRDKANSGATLNPHHELYAWLTDRTKSRAIPHRLEDCGYVSVRNRARKDGTWQIGRKRHVIYAKKELTIRDRYQAVLDLVEERNTPRT